MSEATLVERPAVDFHQPVRVESAPEATAEAQAQAHDPRLVSPEPSGEALQKGVLS